MSASECRGVLARALVVQGDFILLCVNSNPKARCYFLPGGHCQQGESAQSAVVREMYEETTQIYTITGFVGVVEHELRPGFCHQHEAQFIFALSPLNSLSIHLPANASGLILFHWRSLKDFSWNLGTPRLRQRLTAWLESDFKKSFYHTTID